MPETCSDILRDFTLVLRSSHFFSGTLEVSGVLETCSNILNDFSCPGTSESPLLLRIFKAFILSRPCNIHLAWQDTPSLLLLTTTRLYMRYTDQQNRRSCSKKCSPWQWEIGRSDLFAQPARVFIHSIACIRRFQIFSLLFTRYLKLRVDSSRKLLPPLAGPFATCASDQY